MGRNTLRWSLSLVLVYCKLKWHRPDVAKSGLLCSGAELKKGRKLGRYWKSARVADAEQSQRRSHSEVHLVSCKRFAWLGAVSPPGSPTPSVDRGTGEADMELHRAREPARTLIVPHKLPQGVLYRPVESVRVSRQHPPSALFLLRSPRTFFDPSSSYNIVTQQGQADRGVT